MAQVKSLQTGIKFKDTPIGKVPVDWEVTKLGDIVEAFLNGGTPDTRNEEYWNGRIPWITGADFLNQKVGQIRKHITNTGVRNSATNVVPKGNLLVVTRTGVGKLAIAPFDIAISQDISGVIPNKQKAISEFLFWNLNYSEQRLLSLKQGTSINGILREDLSTFLISLPPLPEQKKVAEILTAIDGAIEETDRIIKKTKELKKGLMQKLLTRGIGHKKFKKTEIGEIPAEWEVVMLKTVAAVRYGLGQPPALDDDNGIPMIRATNIHSGEILRAGMISVRRDAIPVARNPFLKEGDIIVVRSGAYTGDIGLITKEWEGAIAGYDLVVNPTARVDSIFLVNYLLSSRIQKRYFASLRDRSAQPHLNSLQVEETPIALPLLPEQRKIAEFLSSVDLELKNAEADKQRLESLKKSLMQVLLTGRVRVKLR
jgi:type I restriction enzyme, S subunit